MRSLSLGGIATLFPLIASAQQLTATEVSIGPMTMLARETFIGGDLGLAHRPNGDSRIALDLAGGTADRRGAARAQLTLQLLVNPASRTGWGLYAGAGGAFSARRGSPGQGFLAVLLGLERKPGRRHGWYAELGFAGGVRAAVGWRARWFPAWWRAG